VPCGAPAVELSPPQLDFYTQRFDEAVREALGVHEDEPRVVLHDIGDGERQAILRRTAEVAAQAGRLREAIDRRERLEGDLREVEIKLSAISDDPHVDELINRNRGIAQHLGALQEEARTLDSEIKQLEADLAVSAREIERVQRTREATTRAKKTIRLAQHARRVLDQFIKRLAPEKLALLRRHMEDMYGRLRKPEDPVHRIDIDPETWQVILRDGNGRPLEKRVFSAGMKEMYALSLLWALGQASGHDLPVVIDTPLGRLDSKNREALCRNYFSHASHQVILLSTDQEIDQEWFRLLQPHVALQYRLDNDPSTQSTVVHRGYFF